MSIPFPMLSVCSSDSAPVVIPPATTKPATGAAAGGAGGAAGTAPGGATGLDKLKDIAGQVFIFVGREGRRCGCFAASSLKGVDMALIFVFRRVPFR